MLNNLKYKITQKLIAIKNELRAYISKNGTTDVRDIQAMRLLALILMIAMTISLIIDGLTGVSRNLFGDDSPRRSELNWDVEVPQGYSIKEVGSFSNDHYGVFYEEWSGNYQVIIYGGREYSLSQIKSHINNQLLEFKDFEDYEYFETHKIIFTDRRSENYPSMEIPQEIND